MINGQLNQVPTVTQLITAVQTDPVAETMEGTKQNVENFAELLNGIQLKTNAKNVSAFGQAEAFQGNYELASNAVADNPVVDLLAQLNVSSLISPAAETLVQKPEVMKKSDLSSEVVLPDAGEQSGIVSQIALAAYSHPGRMPEVNKPTPLPVDRLQNVASATEQQEILPVPGRNSQRQSETIGTMTVDRQPVTTAKTPEVQTNSTATAGAPTVVHSEPVADQPEAILRIMEVNKPAPLPVDRLQKVAIATDQPAVITAPAIWNKTEPNVVEPTKATQQESAVTLAGKPGAEPIAVKQQRQPETIGIRQINTESGTKAQAPESQTKPTAAPAVLAAVQPESVLTIPNVKSSLPLHDERLYVAIAPDRTAVVTAANPMQSVHEAASTKAQSALPVTTSQELELEVAALITAAPVLADTRSAALVQKINDTRELFTADLQIEKVLTSEKQGVEKGMVPSIQMPSSGSESTSGPETSGNNQSGVNDNQMPAQDMRGLLSTEHQKSSAAITKPLTPEPVQQDVSEQVTQQVKERLVQVDVKPGTQKITLTLSPEGLGELKMNLNLQGQKLSVEIVAENRTVRDALVQHTDALKESLARQNITVESFDVTTGGKGSGSHGQNQGAWRELAKQQQQQFWASPRGYQTAQAENHSEKGSYQRPQGQSVIDIHY